jgi:hypothetical protein
MDRGQFDTLARLVGTKRSRRAALGTVLGAVLLGRAPGVPAAKRKHNTGPKHKDKKRKDKGKPRPNQPCYPGTRCLPGVGRDNAGCDFSGSTQFFEGDFSGSQFSGANFTGAQMAGANFQGADLGGACLVGANLLDAAIDSSTNLKDAMFCHTVMPDGSRNDRDCDRGTHCCPSPCQDNQCPSGVCLVQPGVICSIFGPPCCEGMACTPFLLFPGLTHCESPCTTVNECKTRYGPNYTCKRDLEFCAYLPGALCCQPFA